ncbi:MAG TPA: bifunctional riboflavin kinase/FAD synthetase [Solirubrobacteraceae bacterium]|jgi:riboflavin kinase/FMN adenylyltransferase|nr:bifunctional riboflavin kinase/FAD synthetase [Solirubrobacteraceae bacterium]
MRTMMLDETQPRPRRVAVGEFDGVHLGHREVISGSDTVLTFEPHPLQVIRPEAAPKLLTSLEVKGELIAALGVEELVVIPFDQGFAEQTPAEFIDRVLVERLGAERVSVGENFRFGHRAAGDPALLAADPRFETRIVPLVEVGDEVVSSSHIRGLVLAGEVELAAGFLGAPFQLRGLVVSGDRRGRELGFPTANIVPDQALVYPGNGVYAARADGACAAVSVGVRPTFGTGRAVLIEAYLIDREIDLYGQNLRIEFLKRLRGERRFDSVEALVEQMHRDVELTREVCSGG